MKTPLLVLAALAAAPAVALAAEVSIGASIRIPLPEAPRLVVVQPGVQVVEDHDDEVFLYQGAYYARRGDVWYRAPDRRATFVVVEHRHVPESLRRLPPGHYRRYHPPPPRPSAHQGTVVVKEKLDKKEEKRLRKEAEEHRKAHERGDDGKHGHDRR